MIARAGHCHVMRSRRLLVALLIVVVVGALAWRYQSELIGLGARWYLSRMAARESADNTLTRRRAVVSQFHRLLLMPAPPDGMVAELFDLITLLSERMASGAISLNWGAYIYTSYVRDMVRDRPTGTPARAKDAVLVELDRYVEFYYLRKRPDVPGIRVGDLLGSGGESYTLEEIEQAHREGRELPLR
jgi:hypothetical protein